MAKWILNHQSNFPTLLQLQLWTGPHAVRVGLLVRKLSCLKRVTDTLVGGVVRAFSDELPRGDVRT